MTTQPAAGSRKLAAIVAALTLLLVAATIGVSYLVDQPPRAPMTNVATGLLCLVETVAGLLVLSSGLARRRAGPGGAATSILLAATAIYGAIGLVTIGAYALIRRDGSHDPAFFGVLLAETVLVFVAATATWAGADAVAMAQAPALAQRSVHRDLARTVREAASRIAAYPADDARDMQRTDVLVKRLQFVETALRTSHGGGVGSREAGTRGLDPAAEADLSVAAQLVAADASGLVAGPGAPEQLERLTAGVERLSSAVERLGLA